MNVVEEDIRAAGVTEKTGDGNKLFAAVTPNRNRLKDVYSR